ncbi:phage adaptor protein [Inquilinus limosus]|uniref:Uncharacterized protein n=1 Tax=Inquilinus limosus MP06 TaxID=1398085 RepID=A0A0A0DCR4_9PROT|nr:hypothetical protein [Inquilinus limosus]KGM35708.1 hypothetical protein P409_03020 [Inquilinus limosus MP06]
MTLLSIVQDVALEVGVTPPTAVVGSLDLQAQQLQRIAQKEATALAQRSNWTRLIVPFEFTTVAGMPQPGALPAEMNRMSPGRVIWWVDMFRPILGPLTPEEWAAAISRPVSPGLWGYWRIIGEDLNIYPAPADGQTVRGECISSNWCIHAGTPETYGDRWTADTDTTRLDEELITLGMIWRWRQTKGLDYAEDMATYERQVEQAAARNGGMKDINMSATRYRWPGFNWSQTINVV